MTIVLNGNEEQKSEYLPRLAGSEIGAYSLSEAGAGTDAAALGCRAKISDDGRHYILNGEKMFITGAGHADWFFVLGYTDLANFRRAFKRWEGAAPSEFRTRLRGATAEAESGEGGEG